MASCCFRIKAHCPKPLASLYNHISPAPKARTLPASPAAAPLPSTLRALLRLGTLLLLWEPFLTWPSSLPIAGPHPNPSVTAPFPRNAGEAVSKQVRPVSLPLPVSHWISCSVGSWAWTRTGRGCGVSLRETQQSAIAYRLFSCTVSAWHKHAQC